MAVVAARSQGEPAVLLHHDARAAAVPTGFTVPCAAGAAPAVHHDRMRAGDTSWWSSTWWCYGHLFYDLLVKRAGNAPGT